MEKEGNNYSPSNFTSSSVLDHHHYMMMKPQIGSGEISTSSSVAAAAASDHHHHHHNNNQMMMNNLSFADVMQFADFGPKLGLNQFVPKNSDHHHHHHQEEEDQENGIIDPVYFLKFPVLNDKLQDENDQENHHQWGSEESKEENNNGLVQLGFLGENIAVEDDIKKKKVGGVGENNNNKNKRKRTRSVKTSEEVESQRMTHIAVERNRRKQMNEHLRVLRSLMPGSYVQRGDQASIIGGAIEFVRELEQLLQCLESQKRRRLYGDGGGGGSRQIAAAGDSSSSPLAIQQPPPFMPPLPNELETGGGLHEETAESKSCLADIEVKVLGFDAMIKILSRRRPGQLIKTIAALEDLQLNILHTNITTIEQTVLYSFNVKVGGEARYTAEDIANSVQQIFSFIHANTTI